MLFMKYIAQILIFTVNTQKFLWSTIFGLLLHFRFRHENTINVRKELFSLDFPPVWIKTVVPIPYLYVVKLFPTSQQVYRSRK